MSVDSVPFPAAPPSPLATLPVPRRAERTSPSAPQPAPTTATVAPDPNPAECERRNSEDYWRQASQAQIAGQHEQARAALLAYLGCATLGRAQQHQASLAMARSWADQQHVEQAREWLQRALALDCAAPAAYWLEALLAQQAGDNRAALAALHKALYLDPEFILGYFLRARLLHGEGQHRAGDKALHVCRQLLLAQDGGALVAHGEGISCVQLLRVCDQLQQETHICPSH